MRIVSLAPSNTEILYALGVQDQIVTTTVFCNYPLAAKSKPSIGGWTTADISQVEEYNPDIVFTSTFLQDEIVRKLKQLGIKILHVDPKTLDQVLESILQIGRVVKKEKEAKVLVNSMKKVFGKDKKFVQKKRIYIEEWHKPPMVSGNWVPGIVVSAGGSSLIDEGEISRKVETDEIRKFDPEIIILSLCGYGDRPSPDLVYERDDWKNISAVKNKKVFVFHDDLLNRPGPRLTEGFRKLQEVLRS